jgi:hypothetical protein
LIGPTVPSPGTKSTSRSPAPKASPTSSRERQLAIQHPRSIDGEDRRRCAIDLMSGISAMLQRLSVGASMRQSKLQRTRACLPVHIATRDLAISLSVYAENIIVLRFCGFARGTEIGIYVSPNDFTLRCNLEKASEPPFVDQCISVRQALGIRDARTKKIRKNTFLVFPHNVICSRIYLYDSGKRKALVQPVSAIVEIRMLTFGSGVGCWPESGGAPSFHTIRPVRRSILMIVEISRKLTSRSPSGSSMTALP